MQIQDLLNMQKEVNNEFVKDRNISDEFKMTCDLLELEIEVGELANEIKSFKYWQKNKCIQNDKIEEELADVFTAFLNIVNNLKIDGSKLEGLYIQSFAKNMERVRQGY